MKILFIFLTLVQIGLVQANEDQAINQVRLSLWYDGVKKEQIKVIKDKQNDLDSKNIEIPEELIKALDRS